MSGRALRIIILGLSITSSWGNGHATTYRGLVRELCAHGHDVLFLERDAPWYAANRDMPEPPFGRTRIYRSITELRDRFERQVRSADVVIVGSSGYGGELDEQAKDLAADNKRIHWLGHVNDDDLLFADLRFSYGQ